MDRMAETDDPVSSWLTVADAKRFRDFVSVFLSIFKHSNHPLQPYKSFPEAVSNPAHNPHFSIEDLDKWVSSEAYQAYDTWRNRKIQEEDEYLNVSDVDIATLKDFRKFVSLRRL